MKFAKKIISIILALTMVLSLVTIVSADNEVKPEKSYKAEKINIGNYTKDRNGWGVNDGLNLTYRNGKIINNTDTKLYVAYKNANLSNVLVQGNYKFAMEDAEGKDMWGGFSIRAAKFGEPQWQSHGNTGYLVVIKKDRIEVQRWGRSGQQILTVIDNEGYVKHDVPVNISAGAVNTDDGVNVFVFFDDVLVINVIDDDLKLAVTEGEYFTIYATPGTEVGAYTGKNTIESVPTAPIVVKDEESDDKYLVKHSIVDFGKSPSAPEYSLNWFYCDYKKGEEFTEVQSSALSEFGSGANITGKYNDLNATGSEYTVLPEQIDGYYQVKIKDAEGNIIATSEPVMVESDSLRVDPAEIVLNSSIVLALNEKMASVKGKKVQIDENDDSIKPIEKDGRTLVPVRFVSESLGAEVDWNEKTEEVTIKLDGKTIIMTLGEKTYTIDGKEKQLDVPAMEMGGRTRVPVRVISEAFGKTVLWEETNELIVISDGDLGLDVKADIDILDKVAEAIK